MMVNLKEGMQRPENRLISNERIAPMNLRNEPAFGKVIIDALSETEATTPEELACRVHVSELIVRSVLEAMAYVGMVGFDHGSGRYSMRFSSTN